MTLTYIFIFLFSIQGCDRHRVKIKLFNSVVPAGWATIWCIQPKFQRTVEHGRWRTRLSLQHGSMGVSSLLSTSLFCGFTANRAHTEVPRWNAVTLTVQLSIIFLWREIIEVIKLTKRVAGCVVIWQIRARYLYARYLDLHISARSRYVVWRHRMTSLQLPRYLFL